MAKNILFYNELSARKTYKQIQTNTNNKQGCCFFKISEAKRGKKLQHHWIGFEVVLRCSGTGQKRPYFGLSGLTPTQTRGSK